MNLSVIGFISVAICLYHPKRSSVRRVPVIVSSFVTKLNGCFQQERLPATDNINKVCFRHQVTIFELHSFLQKCMWATENRSLGQIVGRGFGTDVITRW
jgi:hypothetical protein